MSTSMAERRAGPRRGGGLGGLIALNAALLTVLAAVTFGAAADAQGRVRGEYTMVAGEVNGSESSAVYIADVSNQELIAIAYNINTKTLDGIAYVNLAADAMRVSRGGPGR
jgi:hypothetical protein